MPAARTAARSFSVFTLLAATAAVAVGAFACVATVMVASSGGVLRDSATLTRTSGVFAMSAILAGGARLGLTAPGPPFTTHKKTTLNDISQTPQNSLTLNPGGRG